MEVQYISAKIAVVEWSRMQPVGVEIAGSGEL